MKANTTTANTTTANTTTATTLENRKTLRSLFRSLTERTDNSEQTCFEQACLLFNVSLEEVDNTDNTYKASLIDALPLDIKVDYLYGLRPFKKQTEETEISCKDCTFCKVSFIRQYACDPKTNKKILTNKRLIKCNADTLDKFKKGCFGNISAVFGYPEPRITKPVITRAEQISYKFEISRKDGIRLEKIFRSLELSYATQESLRKEYAGRIKELFNILKDIEKELMETTAVNEDDAMGSVIASTLSIEEIQPEENGKKSFCFYDDESESWIEEELERSENIGEPAAPAEYSISVENAYTYNKFDHACLLHQADICRSQMKIKKAIKKTRSQKELSAIAKQVAPLMRDAWSDYKEQAFSLLCDRFNNNVTRAIREIRHNERQRQEWKQRLTRLAYGKTFAIGECYPLWLNQQAQNTLWKQLHEPLIQLETI